jgi:hypothetical protein
LQQRVADGSDPHFLASGRCVNSSSRIRLSNPNAGPTTRARAACRRGMRARTREPGKARHEAKRSSSSMSSRNFLADGGFISTLLECGGDDRISAATLRA